MAGYVADADTELPICVDLCATNGCRPANGWRCEDSGCFCQCKVEHWPDDGETVGQLYDRIVDAGGVLDAYGYRFRALEPEAKQGDTRG